jgi:hypothetical protein
MPVACSSRFANALKDGRDSDIGHFRTHGMPPRHGTTHACRAREVERKLSVLILFPAHAATHESKSRDATYRLFVSGPIRAKKLGRIIKAHTL